MPNEQTDYYRNEQSAIRNVRRSTNERRTRPSRSPRRSLNAPKTSNKPNNDASKDDETRSDGGILEGIRKWRILSLSITATSWIYPIQIFFAILTLIGIAAMTGTKTDWLLQAVDFLSFGSVSALGVGLFWLGAAGALLCGFITYVLAVSIYSMNNIDGMQGLNLLILAVCLAGLLCPIINFIPLVWLWCLYTALTNE